MDMFTEAEAMKATMALCSLTQSGVARQLGVSQSYVANKLRLLSLSENCREIIKEGNLCERIARAVLPLSEEDRLQVLKEAKERGLTVRECEAMIAIIYNRTAPEIISRSKELERIGDFQNTLKECIKILRSFGIDASLKTSYLGKRLFLTVCIEDA